MSLRPDAGPSPVAERLLAWCYRDKEWADSVIGDLREEFEAVARQQGARAARRWHWAQALRVTGRRFTGRSPSPAAPRRGAELSEPRDQGRRLAGLQRDVTYAVRSLARRPALTGVMVGALALGLAANATIFTMADALVLRPFRFPAVDRLVTVSSVEETELFDRIAPGDYLEWTEQATTIAGLAAIEWWEPNLTGRDEPEQLAGFRVSPTYFGTMGITASAGRVFTKEDGTPGAARRVVMSHRLWLHRFGGDPAVLGQTIRLDGEPYEIVGVAPEGFRIPMGADVWSPLVFDGAARSNRQTRNLIVVGRLGDGVELETARAEMRAIGARQRQQHPDTNAKREVTVKTFTEGMSDAVAGSFIVVWQTAAVLLLLVACANVLNLLLARGTERQQEFAVRLALGASRGRIVRQLVLEGTMLAAAALALAMPLAWLGLMWSRQALPASVLRFVPGWEYLYLRPRALLVAGALAAAATLMFSLAPAAQAARGVVADALRQGSRTMTAGRRRSWGRAVMASTQIAVTLALLTGAALAIAAVHRVTRGTLGFDATNVLVARLLLPDNPYDDKTKRVQFVDAVLERLATVPAVQVAGATSALPYGGRNARRPLYPEGVTLRSGEAQNVDLHRVTPGYLEAVRVPLLQGRGLAATDLESSEPVALVSRSLAQRHWPGADPVQRRFRLAEDGSWITVVGVVGDVTHNWYLDQRSPTVYRPARQDPPYGLDVVVRAAGDPLSMAGDLRRAIAAADPNQPISELMTMQQVVDETAAGLSYAAKALTVIGGMALLLALMGIYSLMSYLASRRTQEIGLRMAFGATRGDVVRLTLRQAGRITIAGLAAGIGLSIALSQAMQALMFGAVAANLLLPFGLAALLALAAIGASYLPARRAAGLDPTVALRTE